MSNILSSLSRALTPCLFAATALFLTPTYSVLADPSPGNCECPKLDCGPCAEEQGLTFYSEKCGPSEAQVKSCARPTCVPLENPPATCQSKTRAPQSQPATAAKTPVQTPERGGVIGVVKSVEGVAWLKFPDGTKQPVAASLEIRERDSLQTEKNGRVHVEFKDGNLVQVQNDSIVRVTEYEMNEDKRKAVIELLKGQMRNQVKQKYNGTTSSYQIKTKTAVAGVRGTDFVVDYKEGDKVETQIRTIEGKVVLANKDFSQSLEVGAGDQGSYVVAANEVFGQDEINDFVARGYMTPVYRMSTKEIEQLVKSTSAPGAGSRQAAAVKHNICASPKAELNQCAWSCQNNPKGEKTCRTDLPQVNCLRRRCNANGEWSEESRMPSSFQEKCDPIGTKVAPCDY